jgi:hypothetical protein
MATFTGDGLLQALQGIYPPIVTPFTADEELDEQSLARLVDFCITEGVHGIWVCGTTGEFPCMDEAERARAVRVAVEAARGRVPVIASIGDCSTRLVIRHGQRARQAVLLRQQSGRAAGLLSPRARRGRSAVADLQHPEHVQGAAGA